MSKSYMLECSKHDARTWPVFWLDGQGGAVAEKTFSLRPTPDPGLKCAHQTVENPSMSLFYGHLIDHGMENVPSLAPTNTNSKTNSEVGRM